MGRVGIISCIGYTAVGFCHCTLCTVDLQVGMRAPQGGARVIAVWGYKGGKWVQVWSGPYHHRHHHRYYHHYYDTDQLYYV